MIDWSTKTIPNLLHDLDTDIDRGLSTDEAAKRLTQNGKNRPVGKSFIGESFFSWCMNQLPLVLLYSGALFLLITPHFLAKSEKLSLEVFSSTIFVSIVFFIKISLRIYQRQKVISSRQKIWSSSEVQVPVMRDGTIVWLLPHLVVQGDLILLFPGGYVAADARIVETQEMVSDESPIFRRSVFSTKIADVLEPNKPLTEQRNILFGGTYVIDGQGRAIVVETGKNLQINQRNQQSYSENDELESDAENTGNFLTQSFTIIGGLVSLFFLALYYLAQPFSFWSSQSLSEILIKLAPVYSVLLVVVPFDLKHLVNTSLNESAYQIFKHGASIRKLIDIERLSNLTTLCIQQATNFTVNTFSVSHIIVEGQYIGKSIWKQLNLIEQEITNLEKIENETIIETMNEEIPSTFPWLLWGASQCIKHTTLPILSQDGTVFPEIDDSLTLLLEDSARTNEIDFTEYENTYERVAQIPPTEDHPYTSLLFMANTTDNAPAGQFLQLSFGPIDEILHASWDIQLSQGIEQLTADQKLFLSQLSRQFSVEEKGLPKPSYTLGFGFRSFVNRPTQEDMWSGLTFLGSIAFRQPNYTGIESSISDCLSSGMKVIMMSDQPSDQAADVAYELGLIHDSNAVTSGEELAVMDESQYDSMVELLLVYSQTSAEQRRNIIQHLRRRGHNIGFWGQNNEDLRTMRNANISFVSANNVPHLLQRNSGVVVNQLGFNVIAETLLKARQTYANLRNWVRWYLSCVVAQFLTIVAGLSIHSFDPNRFPLVLNLPHLFWINLLVIAFPCLVIIYKKDRGNLRKDKPEKTPPFLVKNVYSDFIMRGIIISLITLVSYAFSVNSKGDSIQTVTCTTLIFSQLFSIFQCFRHKNDRLTEVFQSNIWLLITILFSIVLHIISISSPYLQIAIGFTNITNEWQWVIPLSILMFLPLNLTSR